MDKKEILSKFSTDPERYYKVKLFENEGFMRKSCTICKRFYWTIDENRINCPDHSDDTYSFIGFTSAYKYISQICDITN